MTAIRIIKPDSNLVEKILLITRNQYITNKKDLSGGFLLTQNYRKIINCASYLYVDDAHDPTYVAIFFTPEDYLKKFGSPPLQELLNYNYNYVSVKNPVKKTVRKQYEDFFTSMAEQEKSVNPRGFWGIIAESINDEIANISSIEIHTSLGLKKIYEYSEKKKSVLAGKKITWGIYIKTFNV